MRSPKQIQASRPKGARSRGPITAQGKRNSSRNSTRHGMFADTLVLEKENPTQFHELLNELLDEHQPGTPTQTILVETIVAARWRQRRIWGIQKTNFDCDIDSSTTNPENPVLRAALALRTSNESIPSHELLFRFEIASTARPPEPSSASSSSRTGTPTETRSATRFKTGNRSPQRLPRLICCGPRPRNRKKNDFAKRTHQPVENTTPPQPHDQHRGKHEALLAKCLNLPQTRHTRSAQRGRRPSGMMTIATRRCAISTKPKVAGPTTGLVHWRFHYQGERQCI